MFQACKTCPATCTNPGLLCTLQCQPGCGCPPGKLIDVTNNRCVRPKQCPIDCSVSSVETVRSHKKGIMQPVTTSWLQEK